MSYAPAPGLKSSQPKSGSSTPQPHPSLPARPPPPASSLPPRPPNNGAPGAGSRPAGFTGFKPRSVASNASGWSQPSRQPYSQPASAGPAPSFGYQGAQSNYTPQTYSQQPYYPQQGQQPYQTPSNPFPQIEAPQIRNPFPAPGQGGGGAEYDADMAAQIAQWQTAYAARDEANAKGSYRNRAEGPASAGGANAIPLGGRGEANAISNIDLGGAVVPASSGVAAVVAGADGKQKTVLRSGGGKTWQDPTLLEWDPAHFRLFVGNLAGEVTDDSLHKAFSRYASLQKARVVRDKRTTKSKGYGFVSFSDGDDYFMAAKEMQGKYIGSHPVLIKRSTTDIKVSNPADRRNKTFKGRAKGDGAARANTGAGVSKKQAKTRGGLKILG